MTTRLLGNRVPRIAGMALLALIAGLSLSQARLAAGPICLPFAVTVREHLMEAEAAIIGNVVNDCGARPGEPIRVQVTQVVKDSKVVSVNRGDVLSGSRIFGKIPTMVLLLGSPEKDGT